MNSAIRAKLSVMMFLEYVIWGAWLPLLGLYLGADYLNFGQLEKAWIFGAFPLASLTGMFFGGQLADRYFAQEKFLAFSHLIGGLAMLALAYQKTFWPFFGLMMLHCFFYVPTLSITNSIAFSNLKDAQKDFGFIRLWGTIGWIAAAWPFIFIPIDWSKVPALDQAGGLVAWLGTVLSKEVLKTGPSMAAALSSTFTVAGVASLVLAAFCLTIPHTPPSKSETAAFAPLSAFKLLVVPSILVLFIVTFIDALVHWCYFVWTSSFLSKLGLPENWIQPAMSIGQIAEIFTMAWLGYYLKRLGWRRTMIIGIFGHVVRFAIYSLGYYYHGTAWLWIVILSNLVHGLAYAFFFATVYIFVDETFPKDIRTSAQSLFNLLILGLGPFLGGFLWNWLGDVFKTPGGEIQFGFLFLVPLALGLLASIILAVAFHPEEKQKPVPEEVPVLVS
jgi:nucleoside transporter